MKTTRKTWWGIALMVVGIILLLDSIGAIDVGHLFTTYWPLLLVLWGASMLRPRQPKLPSDSSPPDMRVLGHVEHSSSMESVNSTNVLGNVNILVTSRAFKGGMASTVFGEVSVDCKESQPADGEHTLTLSSVFGKAKFTPPRGAAVSVSAHTLFGTAHVYEQKRGGFSPHITRETDGFASASKRLRVDISLVFGDIEVKE